MKFSLMSDMHVDFPQIKTPYDLLEENVIVAGDTSNGLEGLKFLQKLRNKGFDVFAVDGNHEHYSNLRQGRSHQETLDRFRQDNPPVYEMEGIPIFGTNGWYPVSAYNTWYMSMNDCRNGFSDDPEHGAEMVRQLQHTAYLDLRDNLLTTKDKCIIVTHTAPCEETLNPEFYGSYTNEWYWNPKMMNLLEEFSDKILVWCHGHSHASNEAIIHGVRVVCNPRGYPGENPGWKPLTIEV